MNVDGKAYRSIWVNKDGWSIDVIDQTRLPHRFEVLNLKTLQQTCNAIRNMVVRGAPLIGATAAYGLSLAMREDSSDNALEQACSALLNTRPTAINLHWALNQLRQELVQIPADLRVKHAFRLSTEIAELDVLTNQKIGDFGVELIERIASGKKPGEAVNILTHCNAGWLATVDWGTATAPIYKAHNAGIAVHVWVDETRPRNQGASLTTWELGHHGVPHSLIVDNVGGHLMQHGLVDLCMVGSDRTTRSGDVCNKIGTYLKALAADDNNVPFYVCLPGSTIDWSISDGLYEIPIEQRDPSEVTQISGMLGDGSVAEIAISPEGTAAANYAFDVTPARLITALVTERGVLAANSETLEAAF